MRNYLSKTSLLLAAFLLLAACGGKSDITGEVVPLQNVCSYEKAKPVAVEGYIAPRTMRCEMIKGKRSRSISGCTFAVYPNQTEIGASLPVYIMTTDWMSEKHNRIEEPSGFTDPKIYDNDGNLIPPGSKIRVYGSLPNSNVCQFSLAQRIEKIS